MRRVLRSDKTGRLGRLVGSGSSSSSGSSGSFGSGSTRTPSASHPYKYRNELWLDDDAFLDEYD